MANPTAGLLIIGDEILSGRTRESNAHHLAGRLTAHGIDLREIRVVADEAPALVGALNALRGCYDHVFTSGGIGPTHEHDDITADCVAEAFGVGLSVRYDARRALAANYAEGEAALNEARLRMARIPDGAALIENPISKAPGFHIGNVFVMAGVPAVFEAMVASVLPTLTGGAPLLSENVRLDQGEGDVATALAGIAKTHPLVAIGSYPFQRNGRYGTNIVLRCQDRDALDAATNDVRGLIK
ncbi:competence/damage-inducible protein A [Halovulum sp. GXIMD14793]